MLAGIIKKIRSFFYFGQWVIAYKYENEVVFPIDFNTFTEILPPKDRFWADPNIMVYNDEFYIFFEELIYKKKLGHISYIKLNKDGTYSKPKTIISRPYHLSYPYIFEFNNNFYIIPESFDSNSIELYKCDKFPDDWHYYKVLLPAVNAVDSTVLFRGNKFWLFTTIERPLQYGLYLYYCEDILNPTWISHPKNPVSTDILQTRSAGKIFENEDELFRPSQDCSESYGYGININRVIILNENEYKEELYIKIAPPKLSRIIRTHTYSNDSGLIFIDYMRLRRRSISNIINKLF